MLRYTLSKHTKSQTKPLPTSQQKPTKKKRSAISTKMSSFQNTSFSTSTSPSEQPTAVSNDNDTNVTQQSHRFVPSLLYSTRTRLPTKDTILLHRKLDPSINTIKQTFKPNRPINIAFFGASDITRPIFDTLMDATRSDSPINHDRDYNLINRIDIITSPPVTRLIKREKSEHLSDLAQHVKDKYNYEIFVEWYSSNKDTPFRSHFEMQNSDYDLAIVFSFPRLIPPRLIEKFPMGIINIHPSLIPLYRGPSPMPAAIEHLDKTTGVTIMTIEPHQFDVGRVLAQHEFPLCSNDNLHTLQTKVESIAQDVIVDVVSNWDFYFNTSVSQKYLAEQLEKQHSPEYIQSRSHAPKYGSIIGPDWASMNGDSISGQFRSLLGFRSIHAKIASKPHTEKNGEIKIKNPVPITISKMSNDDNSDTSDFQPFEEPGSAIYDPKIDSIRVRCANNTTVLIDEIKTSTGQLTSAKPIANGFFIKEEGKFRGMFYNPELE